ncbi:hypothetical protein GGR51DRAFT_560842 [Nemania sp. FL0031]|nr:hypothetical protein GGR51DRAFT_560842 [Nemania sp. FL0031]
MFPENYVADFPKSDPPSKITWRPFYLRRRILGPFIILFVSLLLTIIALSQISYRNQGLATSLPGLHYLWTYGPTAILALVAAVWARVSFQAKLIAPWLRLHEKPVNVEEAFLLDYVSTFPPLVVFRSLRSRDFLVATTSTVSLILSILIVLSTGLITLSPTPVTMENTPVTLQNTFVNNSTKLQDPDALAWLTMSGLVEGILKPPEGVTRNFAYQRINASLPTTAELRTTVDALSADLDCETATIGPFTIFDFPDPVNVTLKTPTCAVDAQLEGIFDVDLIPDPLSFVSRRYVSRFVPVSCGGSADKHDQRIMMLFGLLRLSLQSVGSGANFSQHYNATTLQSAQLICKPTYNISRVDVIKNGSEVQSVSLSAQSVSRRLDKIDAWDIARGYFDSHPDVLDVWSSPPTLTVCKESLSVDTQSYVALSDSSKLQCQLDLLLKDEHLQKYMTAHYQRYTAVLAHLTIMEQASVPSIGTAVLVKSRLLVQAFAAQFMVALLASVVILSAIAFALALRSPVLERNPNTMIAQAILVVRDCHLSRASQHMKYTASQLSIKETSINSLDRTHIATLAGPDFPIKPTKPEFLDINRESIEDNRAIGVSPLTLRKSVKTVICLLVFGIITALEVTLHISNRNTGLGRVGNDAYLHYLWTTVPSTVMSLLSLYFSAVDFDVRALTAYNFLEAGAPFDLTVNLNLLDSSGPRVALKEWQIGAFSGLATTVAMFAANFLTVFTSSLFITASIPRNASSQLSTVNSFSRSDPRIFNNSDGFILPSLVLETNLSYPAFTYENLAIPGLALSLDFMTGSESGVGNWHGSSLVSNVVTSAFRTGISCELYDSSHFDIRFTPHDRGHGTLGIKIQDIFNPLNDVPSNDELFFTDIGPPAQQKGFFGLAGTPSPGLTTQYIYVWGNFDLTTSASSTFASGMSCNDTIEAVDVEVTFVGTSLDIDPSKHPVPIESTARRITPSESDLDNLSEVLAEIGDQYLHLPPIKGPSNNLDTFFSILTTSRYAQPLSALGDPTRREDVIDAIKFQHSIITAAMLSTQSRIPFNNTNATIHPSGNDPNAYNVTVTDPIGSTRVVQDATSTRILEVLLAAMLILSIISWALMPHTTLLPKPSTSIASTVALLIGGNIFACLPPNGVSMNDEELKSHFLSLGFDKFRMGWGIVKGENEGEERERLMVCAVLSEEDSMDSGLGTR